MIDEVVQEARSALAGWALYPSTATGAARAHAGAALANCCALIEQLERAHADGEELLGRLVARAHLESWFTALYLHHGKGDALLALTGSYKAGLELQHTEARLHDERIRRRRREVRKRNRKIDKANLGIGKWNRDHADQPGKPFLERIPEPTAVTIDLDLQIGIDGLPGVPAQKLPFKTLVDRVAKLTKGTDDEATFGVAYHMVYRGLSALGAHPTSWVLGTYLDDRAGTAVFVRVRNTPKFEASLAQPNLDSALLLLAALSKRILEDYGTEAQVATAVLRSYDALGDSRRP